MKLLSLLSLVILCAFVSSNAQPYDILPAPGYTITPPTVTQPASTFNAGPNSPMPQLWVWTNNTVPTPPSIGLEYFTGLQTIQARSQWGIATVPGQYSMIATPNDAVINADEGEDLILAALHNGSSLDPAKGAIRFSTLDHINMTYPNDMERMTIQSGGDITIGGSLGIGFSPDQSLLSNPNWQQKRKLDVRGGQVGITPATGNSGVLSILPSGNGNWWNIGNIMDGEILTFMTGDLASNLPVEVDGNGNLDPQLVNATWSNAPLAISKFGVVSMGTLDPDISHALHVHEKPILFTNSVTNSRLQTAIATNPFSHSSNSTTGDVVIRTIDGTASEDLIIASSNTGASLKFATRRADDPGVPGDQSEGDNSVKMTIFDNGNVGIGIDQTPFAKLAVNGTICAEEIKVLLTTTTDAACWPDYVFEENYNLMPIPQLEKWITTHGHLPDIPSQADVEVNGIDIGEMQGQLLRKVEELTLYIIEQNKTIDVQNKRIEALEQGRK